MYIWTDGIYSGVRAEQQRLCALVVIGMNSHGEKQFLAMEDGIRESTQSWREVLLQLKARGLTAHALAMEPWTSGWPSKNSSRGRGINGVGVKRHRMS